MMLDRTHQRFIKFYSGGFSMLRKFNQKGFTLIELMIVIAIIGILAAIAIPNFISYRDKAYCSKAENDAQSGLAALASYYSDPDATDVPNVGTLRSQEEFNPINSVSISGSATGSVTITVTDDSGRCPRDTTYSVTMGGSEGDWN
jgi:prepilin-type N-terminal cleavage/methylation domain-containing protein